MRLARGIGLAAALSLVVASGAPRSQPARAASAAPANWTQFHFDAAHTGVNPFETLVDKDNVGDLVPFWTAPLGSSIFGSPAVVNGVLYNGTLAGKLYALDADNGATLWTANTSGAIYTTPAVVGTLVTVASGSRLYAFATATGQLRWSKPISVPQAHVVSGKRIFAGSKTGTVFSLDAKTGATLWSVAIGGTVTGPATVAGNVVYVGVGTTLHALSASNGAEVWTAPLLATLDSAPAISGGVIYLGWSDGTMEALRVSDGSSIWFTNTGGGDINSSPAVLAGDGVYEGIENGTFFKLDPGTGDILWTATTGGQISSSSALANGVAYVGSTDRSIYALCMINGAVLWSSATGGPIHASPAFVNGVLYIGSEDGSVYAYHLPG
jgi:outer membrane protein assembly factor BamB